MGLERLVLRISSLGMLRWEGCKSEASRGCIARSCLQTDRQKDAIERGRKPAVAVRTPNGPGVVVYSCNVALAEWRQEGWEFTLTTGLMVAWVTWNLVYEQTESQLGQTWWSRCHPSTRRRGKTGFCE